MEKIFMCPVCGENHIYTSERGLKIHAKDREGHQELYHLLTQKKDITSLTNIIIYMKDHHVCKEEIQYYQNLLEQQQKKQDEKLQKELKEQELKLKQQEKRLKIKEAKLKLQREKEMRKHDPNTASNLVRAFYNQYSLTPCNIAADMNRVKRIMELQVTPDQVRFTMQYMYHKGLRNLNFFNAQMVEEAITFQKYHAQTVVTGSLPNLVKQYYDGIGLSLKHAKLLKDVDRMKRVKANYGLNDNQMSQLIQRMISNKVMVFNFIDSEATKMLAENANKLNNDITFTSKEDDYYFDRALARLKEGKTTVSIVLNTYAEDETEKEKFISAIENMLKNKMFDTNRFNTLEWIYTIQYKPKSKIEYQSPVHLNEEDIEDYQIYSKKVCIQ